MIAVGLLRLTFLKPGHNAGSVTERPGKPFLLQEKSPPEDVRPAIPTTHGSVAVTIPTISGRGMLDGLMGGRKAHKIGAECSAHTDIPNKSLPLGLLGQMRRGNP